MPGTSEAAAATAYNGTCGSGYKVIDQARVSSGATIYLTYSSATGKNCVVTILDTFGAKRWLDTYVGRSSDLQVDEDRGYYSRYAGPVFVHAKGTCVIWGGTVEEDDVHRGPDHCG
ncbi:spore-associated protein A [Streptomyces sp. NPDC054958]